MESHQPVMLPNLSAVSEPPKLKPNSVVRNLGNLERDFGVHRKETMVGNLEEESIGVLEVYIHQARDIHNICIYHKQDVYAKLCLTSDPETTVSTQTINGGGKNPVFNQNLRLNVRTIESSLKCEIYMLSRVRNYLEDQLLGFALVPLSDVLVENGKLAQEFSLSSTDLFHSPAGFVQLSLTYTGASPEVLEIHAPHSSLAANADGKDSMIPDSLPTEFDKIEFPDPKIVNENHMMVSEYFGIPCTEMDSQSSESFDTAENDNHLSSDNGLRLLESFSSDSADSVEVSKIETPPSSVSTNGSPTISVSAAPPSSVSTNGSPAISVSAAASSQSNCDTPGALKSPNQELVSSMKEKIEDVGEAESGLSTEPRKGFVQPVVSVNNEAEQKVVQQEIVDMYLKSMQQFTDSLAKMKLPMDIENGSTEPGSTGSNEKSPASKSDGPRVFYGSRAFF